MKKYPTAESTIRHIMIDPPSENKKSGAESTIRQIMHEATVDHIESRNKKSTSEEIVESREDRIRNIVKEGSMGLKRLERLSAARVGIDPARVKYKVAQAKAAESNPDKYQGNIDQNEKMTQHMGDQYARAEHLMPGDADHYKGQVIRAKNITSTLKNPNTRYYKSDGTDTTANVEFRNSIGAVPHVAAQGRFTAHPDTQLASRTSLSSSVPPAKALHGAFTNVNDPQGKDPHIAVMAAYGGPHHPEGGTERTVEPMMMSIKNYRSARANLPRGVSLTTGGVPQDFLNHAVGDNEHPVSLHRNGR